MDFYDPKPEITERFKKDFKLAKNNYERHLYIAQALDKPDSGLIIIREGTIKGHHILVAVDSEDNVLQILLDELIDKKNPNLPEIKVKNPQIFEWNCSEAMKALAAIGEDI